MNKGTNYNNQFEMTSSAKFVGEDNATVTTLSISATDLEQYKIWNEKTGYYCYFTLTIPNDAKSGGFRAGWVKNNDESGKAFDSDADFVTAADTKLESAQLSTWDESDDFVTRGVYDVLLNPQQAGDTDWYYAIQWVKDSEGEEVVETWYLHFDFNGTTFKTTENAE